MDKLQEKHHWCVGYEEYQYVFQKVHKLHHPESFLCDNCLVTSLDNVLTRWKELMSEGGRLKLNPIASWIGKKALYENAIPLSVFTHALSDKLLKNQIIFDSSLETIQQFEIVMVSFESNSTILRLISQCTVKGASAVTI